MPAFLGIDPGTVSGAFALLDPSNDVLLVEDMPYFSLKKGKKTTNTIDVYGLARVLDRWSSEHHILGAAIEQVGAMPGQGVVSMFNFGQAYGVCKMAVASCFIPMTLVVPGKWKSAMRLTAEKDGSRLRASQLLPRHTHYWTRIKDHNRAEAALLALYLSRGIP